MTALDKPDTIEIKTQVPDSMNGLVYIPEGFDDPEENRKAIENAAETMANEIFKLLNPSLMQIPNHIPDVALGIVPNGGLPVTLLVLEQLAKQVDVTKIPIIIGNNDVNYFYPPRRPLLEQYNNMIYYIEDMVDSGKTAKAIALYARDQYSQAKVRALTAKQSTSIPNYGGFLEDIQIMIEPRLPDAWVHSCYGLNSGLFIDDPVIDLAERLCLIPYVQRRGDVGNQIQKKSEGYIEMLMQHQLFSLDSKKFGLLLAVSKAASPQEKYYLIKEYIVSLQGES